MPCYKIPLLLRVEPQLLSFEVADAEIQRPRRDSNFIYKPWKKADAKRQFVWYKGETHTVTVFVRYPLNVPMAFDKVCAIVSGGKAIAYLTTVNLAPSKEPSRVVSFEVKVKPLEAGKLFIRGVAMGWGNIVCEHYVNTKGVGIYATEYDTKYTQDICEILVVEGVPRISTRVEAIQLNNGTLVGLCDELCPVTISVKSIGAEKLARLDLIIYICESEKRQLYQKVDLMEIFGAMVPDRWYLMRQVVPVLERSSYAFDIYFGTGNDLLLVEKYQILVNVST